VKIGKLRWENSNDNMIKEPNENTQMKIPKSKYPNENSQMKNPK
jgi:hypothetical protein